MSENYFEPIGKQLSGIIERSGLTLQQVINHIGMNNTQTLSAVLAGRTLLQPRYHERFAELFKDEIPDKEAFYKKIDDAHRRRDVEILKEKRKGKRKKIITLDNIPIEERKGRVGKMRKELERKKAEQEVLSDIQ
jgi:hypothetical protein